MTIEKEMTTIQSTLQRCYRHYDVLITYQLIDYMVYVETSMLNDIETPIIVNFESPHRVKWSIKMKIKEELKQYFKNQYLTNPHYEKK